MKKLKNGHHFININHTEKFQITNHPKIWVSNFLSVNRKRISALAIMKKLKNGHHFVNIDHTENFPITDPAPKVSVSGFLSFNCNRITMSAIMKKLKNGCHFININHLGPRLPHESPICSLNFLIFTSRNRIKNKPHLIQFQIFLDGQFI